MYVEQVGIGNKHCIQADWTEKNLNFKQKNVFAEPLMERSYGNDNFFEED